MKDIINKIVFEIQWVLYKMKIFGHRTGEIIWRPKFSKESQELLKLLDKLLKN